MKVQYYTATSLDGFIADRDHSLEWLFQFDATSYPAFIREIGALVMGSSTYEWVLRHHVYADPTQEKSWPYEQPTWVFSSRSRTQVAGGKISFVQGDVGRIFPAVRDAAGDKNVWVAGGGDLAGQFFDQGLLDEIIVQITPVTLGGGAPLFPRRIDKPPLRVASVTPYESGMVEVRYEVPRSRENTRAGEP